MTYIIVFDFPDCDPVYASVEGSAFVFSPKINLAARYASEDVAQSVLRNAYGANADMFGGVCELISEGSAA